MTGWVIGVEYIVSIADSEYNFHSAQDAWNFMPVSNRAYCDYNFFKEVIDAGFTWESGNMRARKKLKGVD